MRSRALIPGSVFATAAIALAVIALPGCEPNEDSMLRSINASRAPGEIVLDLRDDGSRLLATVQPVAPFSDEPRSMIVRWFEGRTDGRNLSPQPWAFDNTRVFDAQLVPGSKATVVITSERNIFLLQDRLTIPLKLDSQAYAPVSISRNGRYIAYARGEMPDLEIVRFDIHNLARVDVTENMAPTWNPVLSEDGSRLIFVSGSTGFPELWELRDDENQSGPRQITNRETNPIPFPTGPSTPIWNKGFIAFEDTEGVHVLSIEPPQLLRSMPGTLPIVINNSLLIQDRHNGGMNWVPFASFENTASNTKVAR
ncbi:MAG: hypothetical protein FWD57_07915 [Polyangiaceae bacterium]|nr:hypothetical protein [Polyangiaceae bacterium]